jgi:hypothetical protein
MEDEGDDEDEEKGQGEAARSLGWRPRHHYDTSGWNIVAEILRGLLLDAPALESVSSVFESAESEQAVESTVVPSTSVVDAGAVDVQQG